VKNKDKLIRYLKIFVIVLISFIYLKLVIADLTCSISNTNSCSGDKVALLRLQNDSGGYENSHAQLANYSGTLYGNTLCCNSTDNSNLNSLCGTPFIKLSNQTNAHVQNVSKVDYSFSACVYSGSSPLCGVYQNSCPSKYTCLFSIASSEGDNYTNSHLASCNKYQLQVCCKVNSPPTAPNLMSPLNSTFLPDNSFFEINNSDEVDDDQIYYILEVDDAFAFSSINFYNGTLRKSSNSSNSFNFSLGLSDGVYYFRAKATDLNDNSSYSEIRNFTLDATFPYNLTLLSPANDTSNPDRTPLLIWNSTIEDNFANYTLDIDDDYDFSSIQFTYNIIGNLRNTAYQIVDLLNDNTKYYWRVTARDLANNQNSSTFIYTALSSSGPGAASATSSAGAGGGGGSGRIVLTDFEIINPGLLTIYSEDTIIAPILIRNKGGSTLNGISLEATTNSSDLSLEFDRAFIPIVLPNNEEKVLLKIISHTDPGQYEVTIKATVIDPPAIDTARLFINLISKDSGIKKDAEDQLIFLKKLFAGNPECLELRELITQAEDAIKKEQYEKALSLTNAAVQSCQELVSSKGREIKLPKRIQINDFVILAIETIVFSLMTYGMYYYYKRKKLRFREGR